MTNPTAVGVGERAHLLSRVGRIMRRHAPRGLRKTEFRSGPGPVAVLEKIANAAAVTAEYVWCSCEAKRTAAAVARPVGNGGRNASAVIVERWVSYKFITIP